MMPQLVETVRNPSFEIPAARSDADRVRRRHRWRSRRGVRPASGTRGRSRWLLSLVTLVASFVALLVWTAPDLAMIVASGHGCRSISLPCSSRERFCFVVSGVPALRRTRGRPAGDAFTPSAATIPGSASERELTAARRSQTEIWPLALFSVGGMMLFPAANDLLTFFVALEVMSLPLYILSAWHGVEGC